MIIAVIALVVLGPNRLPKAARTAGRMVAELRKMSGTFHDEVRNALAEPRDALSNAVGDLGLQDLRQSVRGALTGAPAPAKTPPAAVPRSSVPTVPDDPSLN